MTSLIDKKHIIMDNVSIKHTTNHKNIEIETTRTTTTTVKPNSFHQHEDKHRQSYKGASSSMAQLLNAGKGGANGALPQKSNRGFVF